MSSKIIIYDTKLLKELFIKNKAKVLYSNENHDTCRCSD